MIIIIHLAGGKSIEIGDFTQKQVENLVQEIKATEGMYHYKNHHGNGHVKNYVISTEKIIFIETKVNLKR